MSTRQTYKIQASAIYVESERETGDPDIRLPDQLKIVVHRDSMLLGGATVPRNYRLHETDFLHEITEKERQAINAALAVEWVSWNHDDGDDRNSIELVDALKATLERLGVPI